VDNPSAQMPAIPCSRDHDTWLASSASQAKELPKPYPQRQTVCHPVGPYVDHLEFDETGLIGRARP